MDFEQAGQHVSIEGLNDGDQSTKNSGIIRTEIVVEDDPDIDANGDGFQILLEAAELGGEPEQDSVIPGIFHKRYHIK